MSTRTPELLRELARQGFGSAEVELDFQNSSSSQLLLDALRAGRQAGVQVDLAPGGSQPFSAPGISEADSMQQLTTVPSEVLVSDGTRKLAAAVPRLPAERLAVSPTLSLVAVTAARMVSRSDTTVQLDSETAVDLTSTVDASGVLHWLLPKGDWIIFGFWKRATGQIGAPNGPPFASPEQLSAHAPGTPPGKFYIADVFSDKGIDRALDSFASTYLTPEALPLLRGGQLAYDSIELEAEMFWTGDLPEEFQRRRGYSIIRYLPALYRQKEASFDPLTPRWGAQPLTPRFDFVGGVGERVRYDYARTLTDLYVDRHLKAFNDKAHQLGLTSRVQVAYNYLQLNMTRSGASVDTPENESLDPGWSVPFDSTLPVYGTDRWRHVVDSYRVSGAGVHLNTGKRATIEFGDDFAAFRKQPVDYLEQLNEGLAGGITMGLLTGFSGVDAAWPAPGPMFALGLGDMWTTAWPQWRDWNDLTDYFARSTLVLETGKPQVDAAIYLDHGVSTAHQLNTPLFASDALEKAGYTYDFIDPVTLSTPAATAVKGTLFGAGPSYHAIVLDHEAAIPPEAAQSILTAASDGVRVVIVGDVPSRAPGFLNAAQQDAAVSNTMTRLLRLGTVARVGSVDEVAQALLKLGCRPEASFEGSAILPVHRVTSTGEDLWWLFNPTDKAVSVAGTFATQGVPNRLDLWSGTTELLGQWTEKTGILTVPLFLPAHATMALLFQHRKSPLHIIASSGGNALIKSGKLQISDMQGGTHSATLSNGRSLSMDLGTLDPPLVLNTWHLDVDEFSPGGHSSHAFDLPKLSDWRMIPGLESSVGSARYATRVDVPATWLRADRDVLLDLGEFHGAAHAFINGSMVSRQTTPGGVWPVKLLLKLGSNDIVITLDTTLQNRMAQLSASNTAGYRTIAPFAAGSSGVLGPVKLTMVGVQTFGRE